MRERLQKIIAGHGLASRRTAESWIASGDVKVNGEVARIGDSVDIDADEILIFGKRLVERPQPTYIALNKPAGYVTSTKSTRGESIASDLVPSTPRVLPVGRLDKDTSGLLLMTNDGAWLNAISHPRYRVEKEYLARVSGVPTDSELAALREGIRLNDGTITQPAAVELVAVHGVDSRVRIVVTEGKKRQIRMMCAAVRHAVLELKRVRIGAVTLEGIQEGQWRHLRSSEVEGLARAAPK